MAIRCYCYSWYRRKSVSTFLQLFRGRKASFWVGCISRIFIHPLELLGKDVLLGNLGVLNLILVGFGQQPAFPAVPRGNPVLVVAVFPCAAVARSLGTLGLEAPPVQRRG